MLDRQNLLQNEKEEDDRAFTFLLLVLTLIFTFVLFTKTYWLQPVEIEGNSMNMTLYTKDVVLMDLLAKPTYGDVVIVKVSEKTNYIKRLIGLPGDRIYTDAEGAVYRVTDGQTTKLDEPYAYFLPGKRRGTFKDGMPFDVTLRDDEIFVMGDNRWNSNDSRARSTQFKLSSILGVVHQWSIDGRENFSWLYRYI